MQVRLHVTDIDYNYFSLNELIRHNVSAQQQLREVDSWKIRVTELSKRYENY